MKLKAILMLWITIIMTAVVILSLFAIGDVNFTAQQKNILAIFYFIIPSVHYASWINKTPSILATAIISIGIYFLTPIMQSEMIIYLSVLSILGVVFGLSNIGYFRFSKNNFSDFNVRGLGVVAISALIGYSLSRISPLDKRLIIVYCFLVFYTQIQVVRCLIEKRKYSIARFISGFLILTAFAILNWIGLKQISNLTFPEVLIGILVLSELINSFTGKSKTVEEELFEKLFLEKNTKQLEEKTFE